MWGKSVPRRVNMQIADREQKASQASRWFSMVRQNRTTLLAADASSARSRPGEHILVLRVSNRQPLLRTLPHHEFEPIHASVYRYKGDGPVGVFA